MQASIRGVDWFDRLVAILYSTVLVLGIAVVVLTLVVFFPGSGGESGPLP